MQVSSFFHSVTHWKLKLPGKHLTTMEIDTLRKITPKGVRLDLKNIISISFGVGERLRKTLREVHLWGRGAAVESIPPPQVRLY